MHTAMLQCRNINYDYSIWRMLKEAVLEEKIEDCSMQTRLESLLT